MLPPGHIAAGFLVAQGAVRLFNLPMSSPEVLNLCLLGAFWGFAPDLDVFYSFYKVGSFTSDTSKADHRKYISHAPAVWLLGAALMYLLAPSDFWRFNAWLMLLGSFSHFLLDSIEYGIPWLWPFSSRLFALINPGALKFQAPEKHFFKHWLGFINYYITRPSFYAEIIIILICIFALIKF